MPLPRECALLFGLAALACGSAGTTGSDLFSVSGAGGSASGGTSSAAGAKASGGTASGGRASQGGDSSLGGTSTQGGAASGGTSGGTVTTSGGAPSVSGGRSGSAGALTSGGAGASNGGAGTAGASSGGAPVVTGGGGGAPSGGEVGAGGKSSVSCEVLRAQLEALLIEAQACERAGQCSDTVMTECGCTAVVNDTNRRAVESYNSALMQLQKTCSMPICPKIACTDPLPATCQSAGMGPGHCAPRSFAGNRSVP